MTVMYGWQDLDGLELQNVHVVRKICLALPNYATFCLQPAFGKYVFVTQSCLEIREDRRQPCKIVHSNPLVFFKLPICSLCHDY